MLLLLLLFSEATLEFLDSRDEGSGAIANHLGHEIELRWREVVIHRFLRTHRCSLSSGTPTLLLLLLLRHGEKVIILCLCFLERTPVGPSHEDLLSLRGTLSRTQRRSARACHRCCSLYAEHDKQGGVGRRWQLLSAIVKEADRQERSVKAMSRPWACMEVLVFT